MNYGYLNQDNWHHGWGGGSWVWMMIMMVVFWGGLTWFAISLIRRGTRAPQHSTIGSPPPPPLALAPHAILAERLARGEIEPDDYHRRLDSLNRGQTHPDGLGSLLHEPNTDQGEGPAR